MKSVFSLICQICLISLIWLVAASTAATSAFAQSAGLSISPPVIELLIAPNKKVIQTFSVKNEGVAGEFTVQFHPARPSDSFGHMTVSPDVLDPASIPLLVRLENADVKPGQAFHLDSGESKQLVLNIEGASSDVTTDTYFALVVLPSTPDSAATVTAPGISSLILTTLVAGTSLPVTVEIENFQIPWIHDNLTSLPVQATLKNSGNSMIRPQGQLTIFSPSGSQISEVKLFPNLILGGSSRNAAASCGEKAEPCPFAWTPTWRDIGPYRLMLTVTTAGGSRLAQAEKTVWLLPLKIVLPGLFIALGLITAFFRKKRANRLDRTIDTVS